MSNESQGTKAAKAIIRAQIPQYPSKWKAEGTVSYLRLLLTAMQTARIRASARRDANMMSHSGKGEPKDIHELHKHT